MDGMRPKQALDEGRELLGVELRIAVTWAELVRAPGPRQPAIRARLQELEARRQALRAELRRAQA